MSSALGQQHQLPTFAFMSDLLCVTGTTFGFVAPPTRGPFGAIRRLRRLFRVLRRTWVRLIICTLATDCADVARRSVIAQPDKVAYDGVVVV